MTAWLVRLPACFRADESVGRITAYINGEIAEHFGMDDLISPREVAAVVADLVEAWRARPDTASAQSR